jgi:pimeloyl-ACP methyl ester carboxylesterase
MNEARYREAERRLWASVGVTPTEQRVRLERTGLTVRVQEVGQGLAVVLVHGASNSGTSWAGLVAGLDGFRCLLLDRPGCGLSDPLAGIRAPVYFLWGTEDPLGDPEGARRFVAQLPHAQLELVPGAGHAVWMDDPDRAAATVRRFLGGP